jgi:HK97 family phage major capsid protein
LTSIEKLPGIIELGVQMPRVADLIPQTGTDATTIRYIQEVSLTNAAAAVAEEGQYPEASWDYAEVDAAVRKIGVIGRVTEETFADYAQLQAYVNGRLRYMIDIKEDSELLNGTGLNNRIKGLLQFTGIQTQAQAGDTAPDAILKGKTKVLTNGFFNPDAVIINPNDWSRFQMMKDANGQYIFGGPSSVGAYGAGGVSLAQIWRLPVIETTSIAEGTALVGAFRLGAGIFRKLVIVVETTNSDGTDFQYGRIAVRAQTRLTQACYRPLAFCTVTGLQ